MPNTGSLSAPSRPVVLTGFDLELNCPRCDAVQLVADDSADSCFLAPDEYVALHGFPGRYLLTYQLHCQRCSHQFGGRLVIRSRAAPSAPQRRVWAG